jgi:G3E family GTPase
MAPPPSTAHGEALKQAAVAERIVLTKTDLADPEAAMQLRTPLQRLNPRARVLEAIDGAVPAGDVIGTGLFDAAGKIADVREWADGEAVEEAEQRSHAHPARHGHGSGHGGITTGITTPMT